MEFSSIFQGKTPQNDGKRLWARNMGQIAIGAFEPEDLPRTGDWHILWNIRIIWVCSMTETSASDFQKRLGEFTDIARREPVMITRHGRPSLVLLAAEDYERLRLIEERSTRAIRTADLPDETIEAIMTADLSHLPTD